MNRVIVSIIAAYVLISGRACGCLMTELLGALGPRLQKLRAHFRYQIPMLYGQQMQMVCVK